MFVVGVILKAYSYRRQKLKWYEMLIWDNMRETWKRLPPQLKKEIIESGVNIPEDMSRGIHNVDIEEWK